MDRRTEENKISIKDLNLASYLNVVEGVKLVGTDRTKPSEINFIFSPKGKVEILINDYWLGKTESIQPKKLFNSQRDLKDLIFKGK